MTKISLIAAIASETNAIGQDDKLLFKISDDLKRFKGLTIGHPVIMGRKTFESIGKSLPERLNIVVTRNREYSAHGVEIAHNMNEAIERARQENTDEIFVIGGGEIYEMATPLAERVYLTLVESNLSGDSFFPDYSEFKKTISSESKIDKKTGLKYKFLVLEK